MLCFDSIPISRGIFEKSKSKIKCSKSRDDSFPQLQTLLPRWVRESCVFFFLWVHEESSIYKVNWQLARKGLPYTWQWLAERGHHLRALADSLKMFRTRQDWLALSAHGLNHFNTQVKLWKFPSFDKHHAAARQSGAMMGDGVAFEKQEKTKHKQEAFFTLPLIASVCRGGSEDWLWIGQDIWALPSYRGSQCWEGMTDVGSVLGFIYLFIFFQVASLCLMDCVRVHNRGTVFHLLSLYFHRVLTGQPAEDKLLQLSAGSLPV